ncbi:cyclophilin-like fold protein [Paenibacillus pedocola]|uniref:cyclophilin-like fold protein n=1 Tax=Paenibacillus pedocola TaxID=3242193 RepID=UPI00287781B2|nr:cyclophilin-like fold protein [Paenibacillus typhae]
MRSIQTLRLTSLLLGTALTFSTVSTAFAADYNDVSDSAWYRTAVDFVTERNLMSGNGAGNFEPETTMSRAMLVTVLHRIDGSPAAAGNGGFSDVPVGSYFASAIAWAKANRIVTGVDERSFSPLSLITREQFSTILYRYAEAKGYDISGYTTLDGYTDASEVSAYAKAAMHWMVGIQNMQGSRGKLSPSGSATRAQAATMLMRFLDNISIKEQHKENNMINMTILVGKAAFKAKMYDNETTRALITQMPITVNMSELNGQEKYYRFQSDLPVGSTEAPATIHAGEIMLWYSNSLVLFYETFSNAYGGYTKLGYIEDISGLTAALGPEAAQVTYSIDD